MTIEQKFNFVKTEAGFLLDWLEHSLIRDPNYYFGTISSIYYDTPKLDLYYEKRNSDYLKTKLRLRWYANLNTAKPDEPITCFLELKQKTGTTREKQRRKLSLNLQALKINPFSNKEILDLPGTTSDFNYYLNGLLLPMAVIQYKRYRFVDPLSGSRVSLDFDIFCPAVNTQFVVGNVPVHLDTGVLEIKGSGLHLLKTLQPIESFLKKETFSKYAQCLEYLDNSILRRI